MKTSVDVHNFLLSCNIPHEIVPLDTPILTAERAAALLKLEIGEITKSVILITDGEPVIAIVSGDKHVDLEKVRRQLGASEIRLAESKELVELTGYPGGATPPLAHDTKLKTLIDSKVMKADVVYTGGGDVTSILKIRSTDLQKITDSQIADIAI